MADERRAFSDAMVAALHSIAPKGEPLDLSAPLPPGLITVGDFLELVVDYGEEECPTPPA